MDIRQIPMSELVKAVYIPDNAPTWLTRSHIVTCADKTRIQESWQPKVGDWYMCTDLGQVCKITDLSEYYSEENLIDTDCRKDSNGRWPCDTYLPEPSTM
jgi:hypothetical protein